MTRKRRIAGAGLAVLATLATLTFAGQAVAVGRTATGTVGLTPQRPAAVAEPDPDSRGRDGYGYGETPPAGEVPSVPPGTAPPGTVPPSVPSSPPAGATPPGVPGTRPPTIPGTMPPTIPGTTPPTVPGITPPVGPPGGEGGVSPGGVPEELPITGTSMIGMVILGSALAVAGVGVRILARRRKTV